jgi:hypothetical protein
MPRSFFVIALIFSCLIISPAWGQTFHSVLSKLDQSYYYPQKQRLSSLSVRVQWEQLDVASGSGKFLRNPDLIFTWKQDSVDGLGNFKLAKRQEEERFPELVQQVKPYRELIIPLFLKQKFSDYGGRIHTMEGNKLILKLNPQLNPDTSYRLLVDTKEWVIRKVRFQQTGSPENVAGEMRYLKLEGKFAISESRSRFEVKGQEYSEVTRYRYKKIEGIWMVSQIDQTLKQEDYVLQTHVIKFSDFRIALSPVH